MQRRDAASIKINPRVIGGGGREGRRQAARAGRMVWKIVTPVLRHPRRGPAASMLGVAKIIGRHTEGDRPLAD